MKFERGQSDSTSGRVFHVCTHRICTAYNFDEVTDVSLSVKISGYILKGRKKATSPIFNSETLAEKKKKKKKLISFAAQREALR